MTKLKAPIHTQATSGKMDEETILVTLRRIFKHFTQEIKK